MVYSPPNNDKKSQIPLADSVAHLVAGDIDIGATRLQPPKIRTVHGRKVTGEKRHASPVAKLPGPITVWETPYNRPAFDTPENVQYTRLALQYLQQGRIEDAERLYKQALVVAERTFSATDSAVFRAIEDLAGFYFAHERYQQAEPLVARLLKHRIDNLRCDDWLLIRTVDQLAEIYEKCGQPLSAQALYKMLLARQEDVIGRKSLVCAFTLSRLAESYLRQDRLQAAETLMLTMLEIQESHHGRCSIEISTTLQELASIYHKLGRIDKAAEMLERLLHVLETIHGDCGLSVASCLLKLADLLAEVGMTFEAEPLYRRAQEIYRISYGDTTAAHSVFKRKLERVTKNQISKLSKDKPRDQEECARFPALRLNLDDMLPSKLGTGQVNRCLGHAVSAESKVVQPVAQPKTTTISGADPLLDSLFVVYADSVDVSISTSEWCLTDELVKTENPQLPGLEVGHRSNASADGAHSSWYQAGSESYSIHSGRGSDTLKLPALSPDQSFVKQSDVVDTMFTGTETIEFETPLAAFPPQPESQLQLFAAFTGDTLEFHAPRHLERVTEEPLAWNIAGSGSSGWQPSSQLVDIPAPRQLERSPSQPSISPLHAALSDTLEFPAPRQLEQVSRQSSPWHEVGSEPAAVDPGRAFETLKLHALPEDGALSESSLNTSPSGLESSGFNPVPSSGSPELSMSGFTGGLPELVPPLQQVYATTYSGQRDRTVELIRPSLPQSAHDLPVVPTCERTAEMVPPVAPPWTSQNYITGLLENIAPQPVAAEEEAAEVFEFVETREGIIEALKGMTVTMLETSANFATPIDTSPPAVPNQNPDAYFQALMDEIAGSPPEPLQRVSKGELIQIETELPKPTSMRTTSKMPYLDPQRAALMLKPASTNFVGDSGTDSGAPVTMEIVRAHADTQPVETVAESTSLPGSSWTPGLELSGSHTPYVSKTIKQLDKLSADKHAKALAQRNPLANSLSAKVTQSDIAPAIPRAPESLASALSARTQTDLSSVDEPSRTKTRLSPLSKVKAAITSKMPAIDRDQKTPAQLRETVKESPLMPQAAPTPKRQSKVKTMYPVSAPHRARF